DAAFSRLQQARFNARRAFAAYNTFQTAATASTDSISRGQLRTIEGYVYVTLSEGWCGSVPFSRVPETGPISPTDIKEGPGLSTAQMNDTAVTRFNEALLQDPSNRLALIGKARALLNNGNFNAARAAVQGIPTNYVFLLQHSTNTSNENNPMASLMQNGRYGVANLEGAQTATGTASRSDVGTTATTGISAEGLPFRGARDVRVPYERKPTNGLCFSSSYTCYINDNYPILDADVPLASGVEARLIEAEAALQAGDAATMMTRLNDLRAQATALAAALYPNRQLVEGVSKTNNIPNGLAPLADPADPLTSAAAQFEARRALLFRERAFWLFNTGHRQGDLRRLARAPYNFATNVLFPSGPFFRGGAYGNDVAYSVPFNETNNTQFNPANCDTTKP
ncbi:MAG: RagB/SusD protein, partial [Gemmatimonadetes bacterium]|nr:RagB/SusD protein [Gemmatimonadota bacterium]